MSNCSSGCQTQDHPTYGECMRSKTPRVAYCDSANGRDYSRQKAWDRELSDYKEARAEGIQPAGTKAHQVETAKRISDATGTAWSSA